MQTTQATAPPAQQHQPAAWVPIGTRPGTATACQEGSGSWRTRHETHVSTVVCRVACQFKTLYTGWVDDPPVTVGPTWAKLDSWPGDSWPDTASCVTPARHRGFTVAAPHYISVSHQHNHSALAHQLPDPQTLCCFALGSACAGWHDSVHLAHQPGSYVPECQGTPRDLEEKEMGR